MLEPSPNTDGQPEPSTRQPLPKPRDLAQQVDPSTRQGNAEVRARTVLKSQPKVRQTLMAEMRLLHSSLAEIQDASTLGDLTDSVLLHLANIAPQSELLVRAYGLGFQARELIEKGELEEAKNKIKFWLSRFAKLF